MVQIIIHSFSNLELIDDYECVDEDDEEEKGEKGSEEKKDVVVAREDIFHITDCPYMRDNMTIVGADDGHYRSTKDTVRVEVQDGGNAIGGFEKWVSQFVIGKRFDAFMLAMEKNLNCAFGPIACRRVSAEMKKALPRVLHKVCVGGDEKSNTSMLLTVDPKEDFLHTIYDRKYSENQRWMLYYYRIVEALDNASVRGLFISAY